MSTSKTKKKVPLTISGEQLDFLKKVAKMAGLTVDDVVGVVLATYLVRSDRDNK